MLTEIETLEELVGVNETEVLPEKDTSALPETETEGVLLKNVQLEAPAAENVPAGQRMLEVAPGQ